MRCKDFFNSEEMCFYSHNRSLYNSSDAVLFKGRALRPGKMPQYRFSNQKWIFFEREPPYKVSMMTNLSQYAHVFNITSTYSFDSDVPLHQPRRFYKDFEELHRLRNVDYAKNKTRLVAWFVSICKSQSKREDFVKELQKYIKVDIYGDCGPLKCGSNSQSGREVCDRKLLNHVYKFYLSLENSLCREYVTEKLWTIQLYNVIPIVMGNVDYSNILPSDSYIDDRNFSSIDTHDHLFNQYVRNKNSLTLNHHGPYIPYVCRLCKYLHANQNMSRTTYDISKFWSLKNQCISPREYFAKEEKII